MTHPDHPELTQQFCCSMMCRDPDTDTGAQAKEKEGQLTVPLDRKAADQSEEQT